jgi:hypothetical protein
VKEPLTIEAPERVAPGEPFDGTVGWQLAAAPASAVLRLAWRTAGAGVTDEHVVETVDVAGLPAAGAREVVAGDPYRGLQPVDALAPGPLRAIDMRRFRLRAPPSPPSFRGTLVRLEWRLELAVGDAGQVVRALVVSPLPHPIELP